MAEKDKKKKKTGIGLAAWLLVAIVLLIIFLVKWETIHNNLVRAGVIQGELIEKTEKPEKPENTKPKKEKKNKSITLNVQEEKPKEQQPIIIAPPAPEKSQSDSVVAKPKTEENSSETKIKIETEKAENKSTEKTSEKPAKEENAVAEKNGEPKAEPKKEEQKPEPKQVAKTDVKLCFIVIDADGTLNYKIVTRSVNKSDSPLSTAIRLVLEGPSMSLAAEKNCQSLIPHGTKLLGASVSNGVATLNFSDAFEFNPDGMEGYIAQLKQIIFTATQFDTVKSVQFLIEGKKVEYLGSDGVWIGTPLSRTSF